MAGYLSVWTRGKVARVEIANPDKRNALDPDLCDQLIDKLASFHDTDTRAIVLTGAGNKAFCAGFDISALSASVQGNSDGHPFERLITAVAGCEIPLVAALNGGAYGGGLELAATCDMRVGHSEVKMAMPPAKLGIVYRTAGLARFSALVGESRARQMFLTARTITADVASHWGLLDYVVPADDVDGVSFELANEIAAHPPLATRGTRAAFEALIRRRANLERADRDDVEHMRAEAWRSPEAEAARAAFKKS
jgi:enoyl-CoA hydratase/carnithine racemase